MVLLALSGNTAPYMLYAFADQPHEPHILTYAAVCCYMPTYADVCC